MHRLTILASTLLTLAVNAAPLGAAPKHDACGPDTQIPSDPRDTCKEQPTILGLGAKPGAYNITSTEVPGGYGQIYDNVECDPVIAKLCNLMSFDNITLGKWYFDTAVGRYGTCQMGFYLPKEKGAAPKPATVWEDGNNGNQCKNILGAIRWAAKSTSPPITSRFNAETVNLVKPPVGVEGMWPLTEGTTERSDGQAVNPLYPSYIWQYKSNLGKTETLLSSEERNEDRQNEDQRNGNQQNGDGGYGRTGDVGTRDGGSVNLGPLCDYGHNPDSPYCYGRSGGPLSEW
ncbi:MAG: hypothetical protein Q9226_005899 [Calogaya cf. arnoldii]